MTGVDSSVATVDMGGIEVGGRGENRGWGEHGRCGNDENPPLKEGEDHMTTPCHKPPPCLPLLLRSMTLCILKKAWWGPLCATSSNDSLRTAKNLHYLCYKRYFYRLHIGFPQVQMWLQPIIIERRNG